MCDVKVLDKLKNPEQEVETQGGRRGGRAR